MITQLAMYSGVFIVAYEQSSPGVDKQSNSCVAWLKQSQKGQTRVML